MSAEDNLRTVEKLFVDINEHQLGRSRDAYTANYMYEAPGLPGTVDLDASIAYTQGFITAFPDLHFDLMHKVTQGDFVAVSWVGSGTHTGPLATPTGDMLPATNKKAKVPGSTFYQFNGSKVVRSWVYWDMVSLLAQLGLMPGM